MRNYIHFGPVSVKVSNKYLAPWGYPRVKIGGLSLWSWDNHGEFMPVSYHPATSITWLWAAHLTRRQGKSYRHNCGGVRRFRLPFGWCLEWHWQHAMWKTKS